MNLLLLSLLVAACITLTQQAHAPRDSHSDEDLVPGDAGSCYSSRVLQPGTTPERTCADREALPAAAVCASAGWMGSDYQPPQPVLLEHRMRRMKVCASTPCVPGWRLVAVRTPTPLSTLTNQQQQQRCEALVILSSVLCLVLQVLDADARIFLFEGFLTTGVNCSAACTAATVAAAAVPAT